jgi:SAM-dependent methyltransferase
VQKSAGDFYWSQRSGLPAFRALIRAMEAELFHSIVQIKGPVLDLGCGDGHFAETNQMKLDVGIDLAPASLQEARGRKMYANLEQADATKLPFANEAFETVISNCVVEHIPGVDLVFKETFRVLRHGGKFVLSVPTDRLNENLTITRILKGLGLSGLAERYKAWFTRMQVHFHMYSPDGWQRKLEAAGFRVEKRVGYMSPRAAGWFDLLHFYGAPDLLVRRLTGRWVLVPWRPFFAIEEAAAASLVKQGDAPGATCCFFIVSKG